jgi:hypothetical protein
VLVQDEAHSIFSRARDLHLSAPVWLATQPRRP